MKELIIFNMDGTIVSDWWNEEAHKPDWDKMNESETAVGSIAAEIYNNSQLMYIPKTDPLMMLTFRPVCLSEYTMDWFKSHNINPHLIWFYGPDVIIDFTKIPAWKLNSLEYISDYMLDEIAPGAEYIIYVENDPEIFDYLKDNITRKNIIIITPEDAVSWGYMRKVT